MKYSELPSASLHTCRRRLSNPGALHAVGMTPTATGPPIHATIGPRRMKQKRLYMEPTLALAIKLPPRGSRDVLRALHAQLRSSILEGRLRGGLRLPPTRALAAALRISRN